MTLTLTLTPVDLVPPLQEVFELGHSGLATTAQSVTRHDTGEFAVMNLTASSFQPEQQRLSLAVGHNHNCQLYQLQLTTDKTSEWRRGLKDILFSFYMKARIPSSTLN